VIVVMEGAVTVLFLSELVPHATVEIVDITLVLRAGEPGGEVGAPRRPRTRRRV